MNGIRSLVRRKHVDSTHLQKTGAPPLAKELSVPHLIAIGVGATIGAGVYVLIGTVAREYSGPALCLSFLIAGLAAALSAFCYAELSSRCPAAGSAYHYSYICVGEIVAWLIGWSLILEYTVSGAAVARGISPNLVLLFGGENNLPTFLSRLEIPLLEITVDPCAAVLVLIVAGLLCLGIKQSSFAQTVVTTANVCVMVFIVVAGGYLGIRTGWIGYKLSSGYLPFGLNGLLRGSATVFFAYVGFDSVASTAEEAKNPQRDLPLGIGLSLSICCFLYTMVSLVVVGIDPYFAMDQDTPISSAFAKHGMQWAVYVITAGALMALCASLMGSILPQPRILMAMARDGLLPSFFSDVNTRTKVPVNSTMITGVVAAILAFFLDVSQLAGMVSVGTLLAFTIVAISLLILRYVPPDVVPFPSLMDHLVDPRRDGEGNVGGAEAYVHSFIGADFTKKSVTDPLMEKELFQDMLEEKQRRKFAVCGIGCVCAGVLVFTSAVSVPYAFSFVKIAICTVGGLIFLCGLAILSWIDEDNASQSFGQIGGFTCPFVPILPVCSVLINVYLLVNLGTGTWMRVSIWLFAGMLVYFIYGRNHSRLKDAVYVTVSTAEKIRTDSGYLP